MPEIKFSDFPVFQPHQPLMAEDLNLIVEAVKNINERISKVESLSIKEEVVDLTKKTKMRFIKNT